MGFLLIDPIAVKQSPVRTDAHPITPNHEIQKYSEITRVTNATLGSRGESIIVRLETIALVKFGMSKSLSWLWL